MSIKLSEKKVPLIMIISLMILVVASSTYAWNIWSSYNNTELTTTIGNIAEITFKNGRDINAINIGPVLDYKIDGELTEFIVKKSISTSIITTISLDITTLSNNLKDQSFKYTILSSIDGTNYNELVTNNFTTASVGNFILLPETTSENSITYYKLYIYIDGTIQNTHDIMNSSLISTLKVDVEKTSVPQDTSGANAPSTDTAYMVPVYYDSTSSNWKIANINNDTEANAWYNYTGKQWANMVLVGASASSCTPGTDCLDSVTKHNRDYYTNQSNVGEPVSMDDILAFYVWIPRYKYKVWNINKIPQNDQAYTYNAYNDGIDIQWESGINSTGNVSCTYYYTAPVATAGSPNETCIVTGDTSNPYYTHPAFTFGSDELTGIWVGKFETSSNTHLTGSSYGGGNVTNLTARIVPNVTSWRRIEVGNMFTVLQNMHNASNEYGLPTTKTSVDSHMMKNTEWGAVAYLTNSIYGKCTGSSGGCTEVQINGKGETTYFTAITGCGPSADGATASYNTACTEYNTTTGMLASTTGNITGVYDMSGGAWECVMGNMSSATGAYTFYPSSTSSTMAVSWYTVTTSKYVDTYAYDSSNYQGQIAYNRSRLGDATGEVNITGSYDGGGWYSDYAGFVGSSYSWFYRGGYFNDGTTAGPFNFDYYNGGADNYFSFRASLVPLGAA